MTKHDQEIDVYVHNELNDRVNDAISQYGSKIDNLVSAYEESINDFQAIRKIAWKNLEEVLDDVDIIMNKIDTDFHNDKEDLEADLDINLSSLTGSDIVGDHDGGVEDLLSDIKDLLLDTENDVLDDEL